MANKKNRRKKKKLKLKLEFKIFTVIVLILIFYFNFSFDGNNKKIKLDFNFPNVFEFAHKVIYDYHYNECYKLGLTDANFNKETLKKKNDILNYVTKNNIMYYYDDLTFNYHITYKENESVYGASLIKLPVALYLVDNDVDLSQTVKYEARFKTAYSTGMEKRKIGENVTLEDLIKYAITYSDNTAHHMLLEFIGKSKLKEYGKSLGAKAILTGFDDFGNQTASDMDIYLRKAYELFDTKKNGHLLKEYMLNHDTNALNFDDNISFAHKYGSYQYFFHDVGLYLADKPYAVSILTIKGEASGPSYVKKLSKLTYEFYSSYYSNLDTYCKNKIEKD